MNILKPSPFPRWHIAVFDLAVIGALVALVFNMWTSDDAFFTFGAADNLLNGYGLRFNVSERVQIYTNPLWLFVHLPFMAVWDNIGMITILISFACAIASLVLVERTFKPQPLVAAVFFLLPLMLSKTLLEFFSSGLENPMTNLLFAWFGYELMRHEKPRWFRLSFIVALSMVNRMDTVLAFAPVMGWLLWQERRALPWRDLLKGALPIIAWCAFSLFYYGFIFPNTKYAKLDTGLPLMDYIEFGVNFVLEFIYADPVMGLILAIIGIYTLVFRSRQFLDIPGDRKNTLFFFIGLGMLLYTAYVVRVGGSYISCAFMSLPAFMALWLLIGGMKLDDAKLPTAAAAMAAVSLAAYALTYNDDWRAARKEIVRQYRVSNFKPHFLIKWNPKINAFKINSYKVKKRDCDPDKPIVIAKNKGGRGTYYACPNVHQLGIYAIGDALLSHLPSAIPRLGRVSHIPREIPAGYEVALLTGSLDQMHPALREYYAPLRLIIRGDLWDAERLKAILLFHLGYYDHRKEEYLQSLTPPALLPASTADRRNDPATPPTADAPAATEGAGGEN